MPADEDLVFGEQMATWSIPMELNDFESYGLWNALSAYDKIGKLLTTIPAHDGDFFPESPLDHIKLLRNVVLSERRDHKAFWPIRVDIDVTQRCTGNCRFCYSRKYAFSPLYHDAEIPADIFEGILEELAERGTRSIRFTGGGEPLLHPQIKKILPMPKRFGLRSCIITNGDLLDEEISELLVANIDHIRVSINAAQNDTRKLLHTSKVRANNLSEIFQQIRYMVQFRAAVWSSQKRPLICTTYLLVPENVDEIYLAAQLMRQCRADSISFRPIYHDLSCQFSEVELETLFHQLQLASNLHCPPTFLVFTPKRNISTVWQISPRTQFPRCISCNTRTIIEATNQGPMIKICGLHRGAHEENLGVIRDKVKFLELWTSCDTEKLLKNRPEACERCIDISMNVTLNQVWGVLLEHPEAVFRKSWKRIS